MSSLDGFSEQRRRDPAFLSRLHPDAHPRGSENHCWEWARIRIADHKVTEVPGKVLEDSIGLQILFQSRWETNGRLKRKYPGQIEVF